MAGYKDILKRSWKFFVAISIPFILLPILFQDDDERIPYNISNVAPKTGDVADLAADEGAEELLRKSPKYKLAYVILVMAVYWGLEIIPLPITSLFPLVLFPLFGIDSAANVSKSYMKESNTIFLGGAIVALAIEYCNLHRRVGLKLITILGVSPRRLMFGIMVGISFLSMWISNTTCTTMIVPIIVAIVDEIHDVTDATNVEADFQNVTNDHMPSSRGSNHFDYADSDTPRHSAAFGNAGLGSHRHHFNHRNHLMEHNEVPRSTLGMLEGHRPESNRRFSNPHAGRRLSNPHHHEVRNLNNRRGSLPPQGLDDIESKKAQRPIHLQIDRLRSEFGNEGIASKRTNSLPRDFDHNYLHRIRHSRNSVASVTEPGRIEIIINLPTPTSDMDVVNRQQMIEKEKWRRIKNMYLFALAYAANIGGTATITGTGPNKVFKEVIKPYGYLLSKEDVGMTFFTWMAFNVPPMLVNIVVAWLYLSIKYCGFKFTQTPSDKEESTLRRWKEHHVRLYLIEEYKKLGKMTFHEIGVAAVFLLVVILWILRDPQIFVGWDEALSDTQTGDSTAALLGAILLFIIPKSWDFLTKRDGARLEALLDWKFVTQKLPWGVLLLLGSGYAIGDSAERTGLTRLLGQRLELLHDLPAPLILLIVMLITALITEVVSNTACASIILPVLLGLSQEMGIHPFYLSVAAAVTASYAFMLPVASPVNAIVFAAGDFSIWEMITNGYILNAICVLVFYINTITLGEVLFGYSEFEYPPPPPLPNATLDLHNMTLF